MKEPTKTQMLYLQMLVDGLSQKQIAFRLGKNVRTVKRTFSEVRTRLGLQSNLQVVAIAVARSWVKVPPVQD